MKPMMSLSALLCSLALVGFVSLSGCVRAPSSQEPAHEHSRQDGTPERDAGPQDTVTDKKPDETPTPDKPLSPDTPDRADTPAGSCSLLPRRNASDIRIVSYNVEKDSAFVPGSVMEARFVRLVKALKGDVYALQEVSTKPEEVAIRFNRWLPLPKGQSWQARYGGSTLTVSRYPIKTFHYRTQPSTGRKATLTLLDLPDDRYKQDLYVMNQHFSCCGGADNLTKRQREADQTVNWIRYLKSKEGPITLTPNTPFVIVGDLNMVGSNQPLTTLLTGDIQNEDTFGKDIKPDWDDSNLADAKPSHNNQGKLFYTWRWDGSGFPNNRLDYVLYTDSVLQKKHSFVLDTLSMTAGELKACGLENLDSAKSKDLFKIVYDHLPVVVDFQVQP